MMPISPRGRVTGGMRTLLSSCSVHVGSPKTKLSRSQGSWMVMSAAVNERLRPFPPLSSESMRKQVQAVRRRTSASMNSSRVGMRLRGTLSSCVKSMTSTRRMAMPR
jgi:hypothetical protein